MPENIVPWWGNCFVICFAFGWLIRAIILPYVIARRNNRSFRYSQILPAERSSLSPLDAKLFLLMKLLTYAGIFSFIAAAFFTLKYAFSVGSSH